ncbi:MAG: hypothetical protein IT178_18465 [Acidobacteria bacterium]|nr:hypothetical protein [Acidobacteriota bacterium]
MTRHPSSFTPRGPADDDPLDAADPLLTAIYGLDDTAPPQDLWPGIEARLGVRSRPRSITFTLPQLALAASLLIAVSAGVSWLATQPAPDRRVAEAPIRAMAEPSDAARTDVAQATFADAQFDAAVADLERILEEERGRLDPGTIVVIERNLRTIDEAIRESRAALDADPANTYLNSHLADARRRKLELLRRAAGLSSGGD